MSIWFVSNRKKYINKLLDLCLSSKPCLHKIKFSQSVLWSEIVYYLVRVSIPEVWKLIGIFRPHFV